MQRTGHVQPEATFYHEQAAKLLHVQTSDSERTDSTGDLNAFGFQTALVRSVPAKAVPVKAYHHEERYDKVVPGETEGEDDESGEDVIEQVHKQYNQTREEVKLDVKEMHVFRTNLRLR